MRTCTKCFQNLEPGAFRDRPTTRSGKRSICKICEYDYQQQRNKTPEGRASRMWGSMNSRAMNHSGYHPSYANVCVSMTRDEFLAWAIPLLRVWMLDNPEVTPTVDRIRDSEGYAIGNIQIISGPENTRKRPNNHNVHAPDGMAWCAKCKGFLDKGMFHKDSTRKFNGLSIICKNCHFKAYKRGGPRWLSKEQALQVWKMKDAGFRVVDIASSIGRPVGIVYRCLKRAKPE